MRKPFKGDYPVTQKFGNKLILNGKDYYAQFGLKGHNGLDFGTPNGVEIVAPIAGDVIEAAFDSGYGNYVKIENDKEGALVAHLEKIEVRVGFHVEEGDLLGISDNTGTSIGPHCHLGWFKKPRDRNNGYNGYEDPSAGLEVITPSPPSSQVYSKEQYDSCMKDREKFWQERDAAIKQIETITKELTDLKAVYTGFTALGYVTIENVAKALKEKDDKLLTQQIELKQVLDRNTKLLDMLKEKDQEDSSAIDLGIKAMKEVENLKNQIAQLIKTSGIKPGAKILDLVFYIEKLKAQAQKWIKSVEETNKKKAQPPPKKEKKKNSKPESDTILKALGLSIFIFLIFILIRENTALYIFAK